MHTNKEMTMAQCPACDGPAGLLGALGNRKHYQCRDCGMQYSKDASEEDEEQEALATDDE
jgi:transposase-like protein